MGFVPPPERITEEELISRVKSGAKSWAEIDPKFTSWMLGGPLGFFHKLFKTKLYRELHEPWPILIDKTNSEFINEFRSRGDK